MLHWLFTSRDDLQQVSRLFLKLLALIYLIAFASLAVQVEGLVGSNGILPLDEYLGRLVETHGRSAWWRHPTLFWLNSQDWALTAATWAGCVAAVLVFIGILERWALTLAFVLYLSLYHAGQLFLNFQWDYLLLEAGFLAIFLTCGPTTLLIFLFHWLLFRLRFLSGISKLASDDASWSGLTALQHYFETQPLPPLGAWYVHQLPEWLLTGLTAGTLFAEIILPFFIFLGRRARIAAAMLTIVIQLLIIATSNHNWFNLLTIALCLFLLDDRFLTRYLPRNRNLQSKPGLVHKVLLVPVSVCLLSASISVAYAMFLGKELPEPLAVTARAIRGFGIGHIYHVFPTMQIERHELEIQGSIDGREWRGYRFRYKPGDLSRPPLFNLPHQPRLDWMMWFVPTQQPIYLYWFDRFMQRLWEGSEAVQALMAEKPFGDEQPRYLRVLVYRYRFSTPDERAHSGNWWQREQLGEFPLVEPRRP